MYKKRRDGVAAVEAALCLPMISLIMFGAIEISGGIFQEYNAQAAAFELAKVALTSQSTCDDVQDMASQIMPQLGFDTYDISIVTESRTTNSDSVAPPTITNFTIPKTGATTAGLDEVPRGTLLKLTLTATRPQTPGLPGLSDFMGTQIDAECVFVKEF